MKDNIKRDKNGYAHINPYASNAKNMRVRTLPTIHQSHVDEFPSFSKTGSIRGMKKMYYGKGALLVRCGSYIYNVTSDPIIYYSYAH